MYIKVIIRETNIIQKSARPYIKILYLISHKMVNLKQI